MIPVFVYLFRKYWHSEYDEVEIVGYDKPDIVLPPKFSFYSMGKQSNNAFDWSNDLRKYFEQQPQWLIWLMEDSFIKSANIDIPQKMFRARTGRIDLTKDVQKRPHRVDGDVIIAEPDTKYRLSTQPSIWNRDFLLQYMLPDLTPWQMETQDPMYDGWDILGLVNPPLKHNEGVRKFDPHKLDLNGFPQEDLDHIKTLMA